MNSFHLFYITLTDSKHSYGLFTLLWPLHFYSLYTLLWPLHTLASTLSYGIYTLQIILDLYIPEKELAKTRSQTSFTVYISKVIHDILSGTKVVPKGIMKTRFEPRLPLMSS